MGFQVNDIFGPGSNLVRRFIREHTELQKIVECCKELGMKIGLVQGTYDLLHVGHSRYLEEAKRPVDILVVGVDSDEKTKQKKGKNRPVVSENERIEILTHLRHVDLVTLKSSKDPQWHLIKLVKPDVLTATQATYSTDELEKLKEFCGEIIVLAPRATTSTTSRIRRLLLDVAVPVKQKLVEMQEMIDELTGDHHV